MSSLAIIVTLAFAHLLAAMSPGPSFILVVRNAVAASRGEAVASALGMGAGATFYAGAAMFGLKAALDALPGIFLLFRIAGALFLLWIAMMIFIHARDPLPVVAGRQQANGSLTRAFGLALWTQLSNPKCILFFASIFVALLPQEMPAWMGPLILAIVFVQETGWYALVAVGFSLAGPRAAYKNLKVTLDRIAAGLIGAIGLRLLWAVRE